MGTVRPGADSQFRVVSASAVGTGQRATGAASEEQQAFFAAEVLAGRHFGNALSERGTRAAHQFDIGFEPVASGRWRIDGEKHYATGSPFAPWIPIYANTPDGRLMAAWVPANALGVTVLDDWTGMGQRTTGSGTVRFRDVVVPGRWVVPIGDVFEGPEVFGAYGNYLHAGIDLGIADAALRDGKDLIRTLARPRKENGEIPVARDPVVIQQFGELALRVRAARALLHDAGDAIDTARANLTAATAAEASLAVAAARAAADTAAVSVASDVFALIGTRGADQGLNLHRHWRNARTHTLHDPRRVKIHYLGDHALNDVGPPRDGWPEEHRMTTTASPTNTAPLLTTPEAVRAAADDVARTLAGDALARDHAGAGVSRVAELRREAPRPHLEDRHRWTTSRRASPRAHLAAGLHHGDRRAAPLEGARLRSVWRVGSGAG